MGMPAKVMALLLVLGGLACAGRTHAPKSPDDDGMPPRECASICEQDLKSCVGDTREDSRYSTCMPAHDACVMECYDVT